MNLNEITYQLKEQGLSYIQIGFVLKEIQEQHKLERRLKPGKNTIRTMTWGYSTPPDLSGNKQS